MLGMDIEGADKFSHILAILGAAGTGLFGLSALHKHRAGGGTKAPGVFTAVFGFAVAVGLILSGVVSIGMHKSILTYNDDKDKKKGKMARDSSIAFMSLGGIALVLSILKVSLKSGRARRFLPTRFTNRLAGGGDATSTFFTY
jgi:hypothetical protein